MAATIPFAMKAAPWIAQGAGALLGKKLSKPSGPQQAALTGTQQTAAQLPQTGAALRQEGLQARGAGAGYVRQGMGDLSAASEYYRRILGRGRGATEAAIAPERGQALSYYGGAANRIAREVRGPQREEQLAELERQKVGQLADMSGKARMGAAGGAADVGARMAGTGLDYYGGGLNLTGQAGQADVNALQGQNLLWQQGTQSRQQEREGGKQWGNILYDVARSLPWGRQTPKKYGPGY